MSTVTNSMLITITGSNLNNTYLQQGQLVVLGLEVSRDSAGRNSRMVYHWT